VTAQKNAKQHFIWYTLSMYKYIMLKQELLQNEQMQNSDK